MRHPAFALARGQCPRRTMRASGRGQEPVHMRSTGGPLECAMIRCPAGHWFNGPIESLIWEHTDKHDPGMPQSLPPSGAPASHSVTMARPAPAGPSSSTPASRGTQFAARTLLPPTT
jgi:hypothetical protein